MTLNVPKEINIAGLTITIEMTDDLPSGCIGKADYQKQKIYINPNFASQCLTEQTFYHELVHWILFVMGEEDLKSNEQFVDLMAHFIYQSIGKNALYSS